MINGREVDGYIVMLETAENLPAVGRWAVYPVTTNDGFSRMIVHSRYPIGEEVGYDTVEDAAHELAASWARPR